MRRGAALKVNAGMGKQFAMKISRTASVFLLAVVLAGILFAMEGAVRQWMPQQLVRLYNIPDRDLGITIAPNQNYHDRYGNNYWIKTNRGEPKWGLEFRLAMNPMIYFSRLLGAGYAL